MFFYYYIIFFLIVLYFFLTKTKVKKANTIFLFISFALLVGVSAIRAGSVGGDLYHYLPQFHKFGEMHWSDLFLHRTKYGYFFAVICKVVYLVNPNSQSFLIATSFLSLVPVYYFIKKHSINPLMSVYVYITFGLYTNTFNSVRASIALGIGVLLFDYVIERKLWKFLLLYAVAVEIHQTFLVFGVVYPLYKKEVTAKYVATSIAVCFLFSQTLSVLSYIYGLAQSYDEGSYRNLDQITGGYSLLTLMVAMTVVFFWINKNKMDAYTKLWMHCMVLSSCTLCFATALTLLTRVALFFYIVVIILFPLTIKRMKNPYYAFLGRCCVYVLFIVYFSIFLMQPLKEYNGSNNQLTIPYKAFWEKNER